MLRMTTVFLACLVASGALAQGGGLSDMLRALDADHDGKISAAEFLDFHKPRLAQFDADRNGQLSPAEFEAALPAAEKPFAASFRQFDKDGSGELSLDEFLAYKGFIFTTYVDKDHDGFLSQAESGVATQGATTPRIIDYDSDGKTSLEEYLRFQEPKLKQFDVNKNGKLSPSEFAASLDRGARANAEASLRAFDQDHDGSLDSKEFLTYHAYVFRTYLDANKNGFIEQAEWTKLLAGRR